MRLTFLLGAALGVCLVAVAAAAQQGTSAPHNPLDVIPDRMPFNIPYGTPISAASARQVIAAAEAEATKRGWPMNIAVVDSGGNLVAFERMDGAQLASIAIARHKARTAALFRRETKVFETGVQNGLAYVVTLDGVIASRGGIPLVAGGKLVGAIGCSGGAGAQDEVIAKAGAAAFNR